MKIVMGLGNPGEKYKDTRHNAGFLLLDHIAEKKGLNWTNNKKLKSEIAKDGDIIYAKPLTFMNESGKAASAILSFYGLLPKKLGFLKNKDADISEILTVAHDDIDIPLGGYKKVSGSGSAGHKGVQSIINELKTKNFKRIRIGIKNQEKEGISADKLVLERFNSQERPEIERSVKKIEEELFS